MLEGQGTCPRVPGVEKGREGIFMPWCPLCKTEYREGFSICEYCKVDLVDALSPESDDQEPKSIPVKSWVFLTETVNDAEAVIIESFLRSNGIPLLKKYKGAGAVLKVYQVETTKFPVDWFVPENQYTEAKEILDDIREK